MAESEELKSFNPGDAGLIKKGGKSKKRGVKIKPSILKEINPEYPLEELKLQYFGHVMQKTNSLEKTQMLGKIEGRRRRGMTEDEIVGWHH